MQRVRASLVMGVVFVAALTAVTGVAAGASPSHATTADSTTATLATANPNVTIFVAPGGDREAIAGADSTDEYGDVTLTNWPQVTLSDILIVQVGADGLDEAVAQQSGNSTTAQFLSLLESEQASLTGYESIRDPEEPAKVFSLSDADSVSVARADNDTYQVATNLSAVSVVSDTNENERPDDDVEASIESGDLYSVRFSFEGDTSDEGIGVFPVTTRFLPQQSDNSPVLLPLPNQQVRVATTLAPGTELRAQLTATGSDPFRITDDTRVEYRGGSQPVFDASFNLSRVSGGVPFRIVVQNDGRNIGTAEGRVRSLIGSFSVPEATGDSSLAVPRVNFTSNGFLIARAGGPDGPVVANRYLSSGQYSDLTLDFGQSVQADTVHVSAFVDIDEDQVFDRGGTDLPFRTNGQPITATVDVSGSTGTPAVTTRPPPTTTTTDRQRTTTVTTTQSATAPPSSPTATTTTNNTGFTPYTVTAVDADGFGVVVTLVSLLLLAALLASRRRS